jgi:aspartate/methionine/tyrosine aminotransferase
MTTDDFPCCSSGEHDTPPADDVREALALTLENHQNSYEPVDTQGFEGYADAILAAFEVRPRGAVTDAVEPYEYCVVNGLGHGIYMAKTLEEAREDIAKEQRVGPGELRPKRSVVRRRRAGKWETFS